MIKSFRTPIIGKFLLWLLLNHKHPETIMGDFEEEFNAIARDKGMLRARFWFWSQIILTLPSYIKNSFYWGMTMITHYLKTALRHIVRHKVYSFINIVGLAVGMACCILILLWVRHETSYDRFHENAENIYRVIMHQPWNPWQGKSLWNITPGPFASCVKQDFPEVIHAVRIKSSYAVIRYKNKYFNEDNIIFADPELLEIFSFPLVSGDSRTALKEPYSVLMTEEMKEKYFGDEDPLGKIINLDNNYDCTVKGVLQNIPDNSHLKFDFLLSLSTYIAQIGEEWVENWHNNSYWTYLLLPDSYDPENLNQKFPAFVKKHKDEESKETFYLQPITKIHLHSRNIHDWPRGDIRYIYFYSVIASFIMLIACFNYMNLSTARSSTRAKEVGLRKVVGADRQSIIKQFLGESMVFSLIALLIAVILAEFFLPAFNSLIDSNLQLNIFQDLPLLFLLVSLMALVGFISGSYPALFLSSFQPTTILRGTITKGTGGSFLLRNSFVVLQFSISIWLIICTLVVSSQLRFIRNRNLGFKREEIVVFYVQDENLRQNYGPLKSILSQNPHILDITVSNNLPTNFAGNRIYKNPSWAGKSAPESFYVNWSYVDYNFFDFYEIKLLRGRNFSREYPSDADQAYIINETAAKVIGWENPIGKRLEEGLVIGMVNDFHFQSLHREIEPLAIKLNRPEGIRYFSLKIRPENLEATLQFIEKKWKEFSPGYPFIYSFIDERLNRAYEREQRLYNTFNYFAFLAVFISCLGLFGLAIFFAEKKTKEIGIRKVLGASASSIILLLSKEFLKWILVANIVSWPIAYFVMHKWLENFAYRTNISLWIFLLSAAVALLIALLIVSYKSIKAALASPIDSLRYE